MPKLLFVEAQHLRRALFLPIDVLQLGYAAMIGAAALLLVNQFRQKAAAALYQQIFHGGAFAPQSQIAHQPFAAGVLVQIQLAVLRCGVLQNGFIPGVNHGRLAVHIAKGFPLRPLMED